MVIDDNNNRYIGIRSNGEVFIGIAYCNYGISEDVYFDESNSLLYLWVGKSIICVDVLNDKIILNTELNSVFYNFICQSENSKVIVICELDVYCYSCSKLVWKVEFREMVVEAFMAERNALKVICEDNSELCIDVSDEKYIV